MVVEEEPAVVEELPGVVAEAGGGTRSGARWLSVAVAAGSPSCRSCQAGRAAAVTGGCWGNDRLGRVVLVELVLVVVLVMLFLVKVLLV